MSTLRNETRSRWLELAIVTVASALTSGFAVTWSLSASLAEIKVKTDEQARHIAMLDTAISNIEGTNNLQSTQIAVTDANYQNILRQLEEINQHLKR